MRKVVLDRRAGDRLSQKLLDSQVNLKHLQLACVEQDTDYCVSDFSEAPAGYRSLGLPYDGRNDAPVPSCEAVELLCTGRV